MVSVICVVDFLGVRFEPVSSEWLPTELQESIQNYLIKTFVTVLLARAAFINWSATQSRRGPPFPPQNNRLLFDGKFAET